MKQTPSAVIVADGGVDLPEGYAAEYGIHTMPLMLTFGGGQYLRSGVDITPAEFYRRLREGGEHPSTSQPAVGDYVALYQKLGEAGKPILSFHLSAGLSGSYGSARLAREMLPDLDIRLIDTGTLSGAMTLQVLNGADMARRGIAPELIIAEARRIGQASDMFYTIDTLEYLRRGGRIGRVAGYVGTLLGLRPIITVDKATGTYTATGRARSFHQAANLVVDQIAARAGEGADICAIVLHGDCVPEVERLTERLRARLNCRWLQVIRANPGLGVHVGPDTVGVAYYPGMLPFAQSEIEQAVAL
jgi:DegV family protein with EDD domain